MNRPRHVLRLGLAPDPGVPEGLLTLRHAHRLKDRILQELQHLPGRTVHLDFQEVQHLTAAAAREFGPLLHLGFTTQRDPEQHLMYTQLNRGIFDALNCTFTVHALQDRGKHHLVAVGQQVGARPGILGWLPDHLNELLVCLYEHGPQDSRQLERRGIRAASKKLSDLHRSCPWMLTREQQVNGKVWSHRHAPLSLQEVH